LSWDWRIALVAILAAVGVSIVLMPEAARADFWRTLGIEPISIPFADSVAITAGWECVHRGIDPVVTNPCDPFGRLMQYPKLWMLPAKLGAGREWANVVGFGNDLAVLATALLVIGPIRRARIALLYLILLLSPPVVLLLERGNADGLMFAMVGLGVLAWASHRALVRAVGLGLVLVAAMLKVYPLLAGWALLVRGSRRAAAAVGVAAAIFLVYVGLRAHELSLIGKATQQGTFPAYGLDVLVVAMRFPLSQNGAAFVTATQDHRDLLLRGLGAAVILLIAIGLAWALRSARLDPGQPARSGARLELFVAGASVFVGSFLVFVNWDYRMVFLLLAMPQLLAWSGDGGRVLAWSSRIVGTGVLIAFVTSRFSPGSPGLYWLGQASKTVVCILLLALLMTEVRARLAAWRAPAGNVAPAQETLAIA
jgi:hypothetical protein